MDRRQLLTALGMVPAAAALATETTAPAGPPASQMSGQTSRKWAQISPREQIRRRYFPDVALLTQEGRTVRLYQDLVKDKIVLINFMYATCTGVCPTVMTNLGRVRKLLGERVGRDIFLLSFTLKPAEDTPEILADYAKMHGVEPGWTLLTGKPADLERLRRTLGFYDSNPELDKDTSNHIGIVRYGNEPLMRWGACPGMSTPEWIAKSVLWVDWPGGKRGEASSTASG
jgi:protein SCO1/2